MARSDDEETATEDLRAASATELGDFFAFRVRRTPGLDEAAGFHAVRYTVISELAGRRFEQFPLDVALGETPTLEPEELQAPGLLQFAGIESPRVPVVALEQHIAEKLHAYTGTYGTEERESSRSKDLVDLVLINGLTEPDASRLISALESTFKTRGRRPLPKDLPPPPSIWAASYAKLANEVGLAPDLETAHAEAAAFINPVLSRTANARWNPKLKKWAST